jgi:hypothetical protein
MSRAVSDMSADVHQIQIAPAESTRIQIALEVREALSTWRQGKPLAFTYPTTHPRR